MISSNINPSRNRCLQTASNTPRVSPSPHTVSLPLLSGSLLCLPSLVLFSLACIARLFFAHWSPESFTTFSAIAKHRQGNFRRGNLWENIGIPEKFSYRDKSSDLVFVKCVEIPKTWFGWNPKNVMKFLKTDLVALQNQIRRAFSLNMVSSTWCRLAETLYQTSWWASC